MDIGWNFRREHLRLEQRSHYVITDGGDQPNVVPRDRVGLVLLPRDRLRRTSRSCGRSATRWRKARGDDDRHRAAADAACSAPPGRSTSTRPSPRRCCANIEKVGLPQWSDADQTLAKALQKELEAAARQGLATKLPDDAAGAGRRTTRGGGSDDIGDISWNVPTVTLRYPVEHSGLPGHNWANAIAMATPIAHKGVDRRRQGAGDDDARPAD